MDSAAGSSHRLCPVFQLEPCCYIRRDEKIDTLTSHASILLQSAKEEDKLNSAHDKTPTIGNHSGGKEQSSFISLFFFFYGTHIGTFFSPRQLGYHLAFLFRIPLHVLARSFQFTRRDRHNSSHYMKSTCQERQNN